MEGRNIERNIITTNCRAAQYYLDIRHKKRLFIYVNMFLILDNCRSESDDDIPDWHNRIQLACQPLTGLVVDVRLFPPSIIEQRLTQLSWDCRGRVTELEQEMRTVYRIYFSLNIISSIIQK